MRHSTTIPLISVILPVHNAENFLLSALESLRYQTYSNFECIAIDDASTDNSYKLLKQFASTDSRFRVLRNKTNLKIASTLNKALKLAKGEFIARMDADDVSLPRRFELQINFLQKHKGVVVVGGQCHTMDKNGILTGKKIFATSHVDIHNQMYTQNPIQHPSIMIRKSLLPKNFSWYNPKLIPAEDLDLYFRLGEYGLYANLKSFTLIYRQHGKSETFKNPKHTFKITQKVRRLAIQKYHYTPSIKAKTISLIQQIALRILPNELIFPLYTLVRGTKIKQLPLSLRLASN